MLGSSPSYCSSFKSPQVQTSEPFSLALFLSPSMCCQCQFSSFCAFIIYDVMLSLFSKKHDDMRLSGFIFFEEDAPNAALAHLAAVIIWRVSLYESSNDDIIMMLKQVLERVEPILVRLLQCCSISWKCCLSSLRWALGSSFLLSFILTHWFSVSNK